MGRNNSQRRSERARRHSAPKSFDQVENIKVLYQTITCRNEERNNNAFFNCLRDYYHIETIKDEHIDELFNELRKNAKIVDEIYFKVNVPLFASVEQCDNYKEIRIGFKKFYYLPLPDSFNKIFDISKFEDEQKDVNSETDVISELEKCDILLGKISDSDILSDEYENESTGLDKIEESDSSKRIIKLIVNKSLVEELIDARQEEVLLWKKLRRSSKTSENISLIENELQTLQSKLNKQNNQIVTLSQEKLQLQRENQKAITDKTQALEEKKNAVDEKNRVQGLLDSEISAHKETRKQLSQQIQLNDDLKRKMKVYDEQLIILPQEITDFAKKCNLFFIEYKELLHDAHTMVGSSKKGIDDDDYNYYYMRIMNKFANSTSQLKNLSAYVSEVEMLSSSGMIYANGLFVKDIKDKSTNISTLQTLYYSRIFKTLVSATIIMSDEFAYMLPKMASAGCPDTSVFGKRTEKLIKAACGLGYSIKYSKPFAKVDSFAQVVEFTKADIPSGYVFEVKEIAVDFGTSQMDTKVIAKE